MYVEASGAHFYSVIARIAIAVKLDLLDRVPRISIPALIVHGRHRQRVPVVLCCLTLVYS